MQTMIALRVGGGLMLFALHMLSVATQQYFTAASGVSVSLTELLIVISSLIASARLVCSLAPCPGLHLRCYTVLSFQVLLVGCMGG